MAAAQIALPQAITHLEQRWANDSGLPTPMGAASPTLTEATPLHSLIPSITGSTRGSQLPLLIFFFYRLRFSLGKLYTLKGLISSLSIKTIIYLSGVARL